MKIKRILFIILLFLTICNISTAQETVNIGVLKYRGGDWYSCIKGVKNFLEYVNKKTPVICNKEPVIVDAAKIELFKFPLIIINGHGKILFTELEKKMLKKYLENGGFLLVNDDFGMDKYFRELVKEIFNENKLVEIPINHKIFKAYYNFTFMPKIHKHSGKKPVLYGLFLNKRLVILYIYESDIIDGWEKKSVHNLPANKRKNAINFGINILYYVLSG